MFPLSVPQTSYGLQDFNKWSAVSLRETKTFRNLIFYSKFAKHNVNLVSNFFLSFVVVKLTFIVRFSSSDQVFLWVMLFLCR